MKKYGYIGLILEVTREKENDILPLRESNITSIEEAIDSLGKVQSKQPLHEIIRYRFGLNRKRLTLVEVGRIYNVGGERIRQCEVKALRKLRYLPRREAFFCLLRSQKLEVLENEKNDPILGRPIHDFELSARTFNCLKNREIETIGDLLKWTERELLRTKNFGISSLGELKSFLKNFGLSLRE